MSKLSIFLLLLTCCSFSIGFSSVKKENTETLWLWDSQSTLIVCPIGPCQFQTIQAAIDAAPVNATIQINPGTYEENLVITKSLKLIGSGP
jgi:pectin methylesterase-like acyl-CoA thioesterase